MQGKVPQWYDTLHKNMSYTKYILYYAQYIT